MVNKAWIALHAIEKEISFLKNNSEPVCSSNAKSCKECEEKFSRNHELENHMVRVHGYEKTHTCEICRKSFYLEWRLKKHRTVHESNVRTCKYFEEGQDCPYDEIGCKYKHGEKETEDSGERVDDHYCYYCNIMYNKQAELIDHMGNVHIDLFTYLRQERNSSSS